MRKTGNYVYHVIISQVCRNDTASPSQHRSNRLLLLDSEVEDLSPCWSDIEQVFSCFGVMDSLNEISGSLKQQCLDGSGLYEWVRKTFKLKVLEGLLDIYLFADDHEPQSQLSLYGARHAKEWSISSAIAGYGFDIVWASGKMWSFLADNEGACHNWYRFLQLISSKLFIHPAVPL